MTSLFTTAVEFVLEHEGKYSNDPADPGGETHWGISKAAHPDVDIKALTREAAIQIYRAEYWDRTHAGDLPARLGLVLFDTAVNCGPGKAVRLLQQTLRVPVDGVIGPATASAAWNAAERAAIKDVLVEFLARRVVFHAELPTFPRFGLGWIKRCLALLDAALKVA